MNKQLHDKSVMDPEDSDDEDLDFATDQSVDLLRKLLKRAEISTYSTAFSGIDSPGTAYAQLREACSAAIPRDSEPHAPEHLHAIDACIVVSYIMSMSSHNVQFYSFVRFSCSFVYKSSISHDLT